MLVEKKVSRPKLAISHEMPKALRKNCVYSKYLSQNLWLFKKIVVFLQSKKILMVPSALPRGKPRGFMVD
jgi:hypothetical protein